MPSNLANCSHQCKPLSLFLRRRGGEGKNGPKNIIWGSRITEECPVLEKKSPKFGMPRRKSRNLAAFFRSVALSRCMGISALSFLQCCPSLHSPFLKLMGGDWKRDRRLGLEMEQQNGLPGKKNGDGGLLFRELRIDLYNMQQSILHRTCM